VCGGTLNGQMLLNRDAGLSPRVRGNRPGRLAGGGVAGSIPACAGEPEASYGAIYIHKVYPRVCGGTAGRAGPLMTAQGLSPRVRGNPHGCAEWRALARSIPACAGEPQNNAANPTDLKVYPRVCGGTWNDHPIAETE